MKKPTIKVKGTGAVHVVPDVTRLLVTIEQWYPDYQKAYAQASLNTAWAVKILEYNNKPGGLAKTVMFDINDYTESVYDDKGHHKGYKKNGFMLEQKIKIDLPVDNDLVNKVVRGVGKFIKSAQIRISFAIQDDRPLRLKIMSRAVTDAKEKASIMAEAAGCKLGKLLKIYFPEAHHAYFECEARNIHSCTEATASTPDSLEITPDDLSMSDSVITIWEIINPEIETNWT